MSFLTEIKHCEIEHASDILHKKPIYGRWTWLILYAKVQDIIKVTDALQLFFYFTLSRNLNNLLWILLLLQSIFLTIILPPFEQYNSVKDSKGKKNNNTLTYKLIKLESLD